MQPPLSANSLGPRIEFDSTHAGQVFEAFAREIGHEPVRLTSGQNMEVQTGLPIVTDPESDHSVLALIEVPRDTDSHGYLALGHHPDVGYYLAGPEANLASLGHAKRGDRVESKNMPVSLGRDVGDKLVLGNGGIENSLIESGVYSFPFGHTFAFGSVAQELGPETADKHLAFEVTPQSIMVTNLAPNGLRIVNRAV